MITDTVLKFGYHKHGYRNVLVLESCTVPAADRYVKLFLSKIPFHLLHPITRMAGEGSFTRSLPTSKGTNTRYPATFFVFSKALNRRLTVRDILRIGRSKEGMDLLTDIVIDAEGDTNEIRSAQTV